MSVMDYLQMLKEQPQEKLALVEDREAYTYARLMQEAQELRTALAYSEPAVFIHEESIARQLVRFLAYSGTKTVPISRRRLAGRSSSTLALYRRQPAWAS